MQEVKILKGIRHPNVLFFRGICVNPPMIITELCEHGSVSDVIQLTVRILQPNSTILLSAEKREQISEHMQWAGRVRLMLDAAKGMLYLHNKDLLHCDLKSLNLLIDKTWTCKVADFGLSRCAATAYSVSPCIRDVAQMVVQADDEKLAVNAAITIPLQVRCGVSEPCYAQSMVSNCFV